MKPKKNGFTLIELLAALFLMALFLFLSTHELMAAQRKRDFDDFAYEVLQLVRYCRWKAVNEKYYSAILIEGDSAKFEATLYQDGNDNGVRMADIRAGKDLQLSRSYPMRRASGDIEAGYLDSNIPQIPPRSGWITEKDDPVKFGRSPLVSFSPAGDSSSGTLYLVCHSQSQMYAVVLFGATARITLWKFSNSKWQMVEDR